MNKFHSKRQLDFLKNKKEVISKDNPSLNLFWDMLENIEEDTIVVAEYDSPSEVDKFMNRGFLFEPIDIELQIGRPSSCHSNAADLFESEPDTFRIATGYALSEDGLWRQHSWIVFSEPYGEELEEIVVDNPKENDWSIIETTEERIMYFGYIMTKEESEKFAFEQF